MSANIRTGVSRRDFLVTAGLAAAFPGLAGATVSVLSRGEREDLSLWYDKPANVWVEALPVGNGRLGAMCFGRIAQERLQLNEDTLWSGGPYNPTNPQALAALPKIRDLITRGEFTAAEELTQKTMTGIPASQPAYGTAGDLLLDFAVPEAPAEYIRTLDLRTGIAATTFAGAGTRYTREVLASAPDQVIAIRLTATGPGTLDFNVVYRHPRDVNYGDADFGGKPLDENTVVLPWDVRENLERNNRPENLRIHADGAATLLIQGHNREYASIPGSLTYAIRVRALGDGTITNREDRIEVRGARTVTLLVGIATSYVNYRDTSGDPVGIVRRQTDAAAAKGWDTLRRDHVAAQSALFDRFSLRIGKPADALSAAQRPTNQRIRTAETQADPALAALYVQYGRYLLMSSSRPGSQPANLQGIWNEGLNPPWGSKFTININTEMNYWPADPANLGICVEPLVAMVEDMAVTGAVTARGMYGARGWVAHHNTDLWRGTAVVDGAGTGMWPSGGAWLSVALWHHYEYQPDPAYLRRIYPLLKGASLFFLDTLVEDPAGRGLVTSPSTSPEREHHPRQKVCAGPSMDRQILRDLFAHTLTAHRLLGETDREFADTLAAARARLPADRVGELGDLQEWLDDWEKFSPDVGHRHVSHLYAVYPSSQINVRDTPSLIAAAKKSLDRRGDRSTGWATAWRVALWARMGDGDRAHSILQGLLGPSRTYPNMFDAHPPFQIDGNFGGTAGVLEMLVQSWGGEILLLPALPSAWPEGSVRGLCARGGFTVDVDWERGRLVRALVRGKPGSPVSIRYQGRLHNLKLDSRGSLQLDGGRLAAA